MPYGFPLSHPVMQTLKSRLSPMVLSAHTLSTALFELYEGAQHKHITVFPLKFDTSHPISPYPARHR
jgi:hypothetical protein